MAALGCVSTSDLEPIQTQLADLQVQTLKNQKQAATRDQLLAVEQDLKQRVDDVTASHDEIKADIDHLGLQIERLQAKLDDTNFSLNQLIQLIKATQLELQGIRRAAEETRRNAEGPTPVVPPRPPADLDETDPQALYDTAYNDYLAGNYDLAILNFSQYLQHHGETDLADNATFWLGECYYHQKQYSKAVEQFSKVLALNDSDRLASARIKRAYAYLELGQGENGILDLKTVACEFSGTDEALLAQQRLQELGFDPDC